MNIDSLNKNEYMFTELFSLLKKSELLSDGEMVLEYNSDDLKIMGQYIDNAMLVVLQGIQHITRIVSIISEDSNQENQDLHDIGLFISAIANLAEALTVLKSDTESSLKNR